MRDNFDMWCMGIYLPYDCVTHSFNVDSYFDSLEMSHSEAKCREKTKSYPKARMVTRTSLTIESYDMVLA
jgi:hypothetical protein